MEIPFTTGFYQAEELPMSNQECVNMYVKKAQGPALSQEYLVRVPGIGLLGTTGTLMENNRGAWVKNGIGYFVNGTTLYRLNRIISETGQVYSYTSLGAVSGTKRVSMADNGTQLMILVPGENGYIYNEDDATPFQEITDAGFRANGEPQFVIYIDSVFMCTTDQKKFIISGIKDGLTWSALDFGEPESEPDAAIAPIKVSNQAFITGTITTEGFQNVPRGTAFPYIRNNVFLDVGCAAPYSLVRANQTFYMIGSGIDETPAVWQFAGSNFRKISTTAIDNKLSQYTDAEIENSYGWFYGQKGEYFIGFSFVDTCFVYDLTTELWVERKSLIDEQLVGYRVSSLISVYGKIIAFDLFDGRFGEVSKEFYGEYGNDIIKTFSIPPIYKEKGYVAPRIVLTVESGVGNDIVEDPKVSMALSKDGVTFNYERNRSLGKKGVRNRVVAWNRNGRIPRIGVLKFRCADQVKFNVLKLEAF